jgi:hypothetical protein
MSQNFNDKNLKLDCFGAYFKKEMEDTFSCNADALNYNNHMTKHFHSWIPSNPLFSPRSSGSFDETGKFKNISDIHYE